jgi:putative PIN family toxin of toxin-antitoxin system
VLRITCDTNVIISALNFLGNPSRILDMAADGLIRLAVSDDILNEVERVLRRPKFGWSQDRIDAAVREISGFTEHVEPTQRLDVVTVDPTDNRILECATASGSEYLVSGDKHLLRVGQYRGIKIVPPADFLEIQAQQARGR